MPEWVKTPTEHIWSYIALSAIPSFSFRVIGFILSSKDKKSIILRPKIKDKSRKSFMLLFHFEICVLSKCSVAPSSLDRFVMSVPEYPPYQQVDNHTSI